MRGFQRPAVRLTTTDQQRAFRSLSRHRRTKVARAAETSLVKADRWGRGDSTPPELAAALEKVVQSKPAKKS